MEVLKKLSPEIVQVPIRNPCDPKITKKHRRFSTDSGDEFSDSELIDSQQFQSLAQSFLKSLFVDIRGAGIVLPAHWDVDHLCYRVKDLETYNQKKFEFSKFSELLTESPVNGRPIATFQLAEPVHFEGQRIQVVELPAPKTGKRTVEGFEHIEVVCDVPLSELATKYSHLNLDTSGLGKEFNQELEICFGERNLKFHSLSLASVIRLEKNERVRRALSNSNLLSKWKVYEPMVAGLFLLGLEVDNSNLEILMTSADPEETLQAILKNPKFVNVRFQNTLTPEGPAGIAQFDFESVSFEVRVQTFASVRQSAYVQFLQKERALKEGYS